MIVPYADQIEVASEAYHVLREHMMVYLAMEERTGKSISCLLIAEMCKNVENILIVTTKGALGLEFPKKKEDEGWLNLLRLYNSYKNFQAINYHQVSKVTMKPDLVILDEAHNYITALPGKRGKLSKIYLDVKKICKNVPIIFSSATPHPQGYHQIYGPLQLSKWSPWKRFKNFYDWHKVYGIPDTTWIAGREVKVWTKTKSAKVEADIKHLFITRTRKELGFEFEPIDKVHYIELDEDTRRMYNELVKDRVTHINELDCDLISDTPPKLKYYCHMLEGGTIKLTNVPEDIAKNYIEKGLVSESNKDRETGAMDLFIVLHNDEKCRYIASEWGDTEDLVIYYNFVAEKYKLEKYFKKARILQAHSKAEGIDLVDYDTIVIYSQNYSAAKHTQRRARQAARIRDKEIIVHFLLVKSAVSEQAYETVSINKVNFVDSRFERIEI